MASTSEHGAVGGSVDGAAAARDTLLDLLSIVTHDLNNPLQSLIVLLELSVDDSPPDSDARARAEQCQLAAERIRSLTAALSGLLRGRREEGQRVWARAEALLGRRFERLGIPVRANVSALADVVLPSGFFFVSCGACLLMLAALNAGSPRELELVVAGTLGNDGVPSLELCLLATGPGATMPEWEPAGLKRLLELAGGEGVSIVVLPGALRLIAARTEAVA